MNSETPADGQRIDDIAVEWIIRLGGEPLGEHEKQALDAWLQADRRHAAAFDHARSTWASLGALAEHPGRLLEDLPPAARAVAPSLRNRALHRIVSAGAIAACAGLLIGTGSLWYGDPLTMLRADYRTGTGETRMVTLADGSRVQLGPDSAIAARFSGTERRVDLLAGVAAFAAVPKARAGNRPFIVSAANGEARALGTRFIVDRVPGSVSVTVAQHQVRVSASGGSTARAAVLSPGQQVEYGAGGLRAARRIDVDQALSWQRGRLIVNAAPLGDAVARFNRYRHGRIVVARSALATRKVSGVFDTNDIQGAVATIAGELKLRTMRVGPLLTLLY
ncbi:FecR family protein [Novosphingobium aerophilum]|uniref:FecR family protein n=1 Tax=Novosphingobium aerophilum TaxID=2839843 RepID=UPI003FD509DE